MGKDTFHLGELKVVHQAFGEVIKYLLLFIHLFQCGLTFPRSDYGGERRCVLHHAFFWYNGSRIPRIVGESIIKILSSKFYVFQAYGYTPVFDNILNQKLLELNAFAFYFRWVYQYCKTLIISHTYEVNCPLIKVRCFLVDQTLSFMMVSNHLILIAVTKPFAGMITWIPVTKQFYWQIALEDILIDGEKQQFCADYLDGCKVSPDLFDFSKGIITALLSNRWSWILAQAW